MLQYWMNIVKISTPAKFRASFNRFSTKYGPEFEKYVVITMESAHAFIKSHLLGPQQTFNSVVKLISNTLEAQYHEILARFHQQKTTTLNLSDAKQIGSNVACHGDYILRMGIPCKHWLADILESGRPINPDKFHNQWHIKSIFGSVPSSFAIVLGSLAMIVDTERTFLVRYRTSA
ncbi:hypothetical protein PSTG_00413 [Puccinia striiformis f. sp. tritici PST-78]|uniref:Uncharacterized protein n=1 Tax=Puccinia striiformis f. sp. tritici PST-78 TaxID=1165861 RepID=A0A0L0W4W6_9BASI|nr:hypothetical protein PSTG_00413 [Puccinia striiformis f. sp. tritici PST-78]